MFNLLRKTYSQIYDQYVDKIYRFIFLKVNSPEIAEDLTSEVFLRGWEAYKNQNKIKNRENEIKNKEIKNIQAFLYQIARNLIIDYYRDKGKAQLVSTENASLADLNQNLEEKAILNSDLDQIKEALANLKEDYREVIVWYYLEEFSIPEIAKILNKSHSAVRVMIHRALQALKSLLVSQK